MPNNKVLDAISAAIENLSGYATTLAEYYIIDSPVIPLDKQSQIFVRIGRHKTGKTLLYSTVGGVEELLTAAPIQAKVSFMKMFEKFFATYAEHATGFWEDVDRVIMKCNAPVMAAQDAVAEVEKRNKE